MAQRLEPPDPVENHWEANVCVLADGDPPWEGGDSNWITKVMEVAEWAWSHPGQATPSIADDGESFGRGLLIRHDGGAVLLFVMQSLRHHQSSVRQSFNPGKIHAKRFEPIGCIRQICSSAR